MGYKGCGIVCSSSVGFLMMRVRILLDRDRVVGKTWFNEEKNRWEMEPLAVPYAVTQKLVENVRIRHDWAAIFVGLKGDDKEYYVDIQELDILFEDFGGFDGLYLKMLDSGIPTAVQSMWIPFSELDIRQQFLVATRVVYIWLLGLWKYEAVSYVREWAQENIKNVNDDIMMMVIFLILDATIPLWLRMRLGMAYPEWAGQGSDSTWYLRWQSKKAYYNFRRRRTVRRKKEGVDPIASAFDQMKRIKNPPIRLKEFASVDSMREEINEVVAFLQNPSAFREMGARAPRGFLIVGERGTGKTSLALAIAAEAKVPLVEVKAQQLEAGLWAAEKTALLRPIELKLVPLALESSAFRSKLIDADELLSYSGWYAGIGCTKITKARDGGSMDGNVETRSYLEKKLVFCLVSYIASQMLLPFGEENFLSSSKIKQAQEIATWMVIQYGWGPDDSPAIYFCNSASTALSMGNNHEYEMETKVKRMYNLAYDKARDMLQKNRAVLEKIVEELLEFEMLTEKDLLRIIEENDGILEK